MASGRIDVGTGTTFENAQKCRGTRAMTLAGAAAHMTQSLKKRLFFRAVVKNVYIHIFGTRQNGARDAPMRAHTIISAAFRAIDMHPGHVREY